MPISQNSAELSQLTEDFKTKGSMARFRENDVPGAFLDLKRDLAWWHTTMLDFVKLNTDPQHTQIDRWLGLSLRDRAESYVPVYWNPTCQNSQLEAQLPHQDHHPRQRVVSNLFANTLTYLILLPKNLRTKNCSISTVNQFNLLYLDGSDKEVGEAEIDKEVGEAEADKEENRRQHNFSLIIMSSVFK